MDTANTDRTISHPKDTQDVSNIVMVRSWVIGDPTLPRRRILSWNVVKAPTALCFCALCFLYKLVLGILHVFLLFCSMHLHAVSKGLPCGAIKLGNEPFPSIPFILRHVQMILHGFSATKNLHFSRGTIFGCARMSQRFAASLIDRGWLIDESKDPAYPQNQDLHFKARLSSSGSADLREDGSRDEMWM